ncbi:MAG: leucine-rich repeat domain-containing protein, partial [Oscillospiraceae bacterium]|nr:leucine-rich repeat domain-containing protein [Oscillospiraceae bacterium]
MSNASDFVIENGVLTKYVGPGGDVVIPDGVTSIGGYAFSFCEKLKSIMIPESVTSIGDRAFSGCRNLESVTILGRITNLGED